ncbi:thermonuclease family protein [Paracoccus sp. PAR01]|uniref:thermonuclease family protein n=1 Tax=Paracoccus sp. PAR01 TaxID=2769282 RepID=UPI00178243C9|nr:thermonuclease family protein [Paracoccus sp. PAR01]MBD9529944.1 thermonuclease family protein [Paracoccus sp. PAR01]
MGDGPRLTGKAVVVDGDTVKLGKDTIRIHGIDAPEQSQSCARAGGGSWACGKAATAFMAKLVKGREIACRPVERDRYDRIVAKCFVSGRDLGRETVGAGLAWAFTRYADDYVDAETSAKSRRLGIWQAQSEPALTFRAKGWESAATTTLQEDCPIKGNISAKGEKIYHMPWSPAYAKTRINVSKGERWFCDEKEAVAAGWRAARWK